ncbi:MAG: amino acid adenylation domain-containing protein [Verrucomicrobiota bacterium]
MSIRAQQRFGHWQEYPLSAMQEGMLYHTLRSPHSGFEIEQLVGHLRETLDVAAFKQAWQQTVQRHDVLRTSFHWEGLKQPVQRVHELVTLPWAGHDWRKLTRPERETAFENFLAVDRRRGFKMSDAPLLRLSLFQVSDSEHQFVWTFHHALLDGRSISIVLREVFTCYDALRRAKQPDMPPPRPYGEFIRWLQHQNWAQNETFWKQRLKGFTAPTPLALAGDARNGEQPQQGEREVLISHELTARLTALAGANGFTLNSIIQGAWALLLSRYSGEEDVVFGATRACRHSTVEGAESMVGLFINTVPVRVQVDSQCALLPWLGELRQQWVALRDHEHTPLVKVQSWSDAPPGMRLFDSIVVFEKGPLNQSLGINGEQSPNREFQLIEQPGHPLTLAAYGGEELCLKMEFDRSRFEASVIDRMLAHLKTLLTNMAANPNQCLGEIPLLPPEERQQLEAWGEATASFPADACLHQLFEAQAAKPPDAVAVACDGQSITYRELNRRANGLARHLQQAGLRPDTLVGLCLERSVEMVVAILAILKAGGAYVPIDPSCPSERVAFILKDSNAPVLLTQRKLLPTLPLNNARIICIDESCPPYAGSDAPDNPASDVAPDNVAYVIYTSGSTGKPKGVMVTHRNVARLFEATRDWFHFDQHDVWTLFHSYAFDFSVWEMWGALLHGGRLVVVPHLVSRSPEAFLELLGRERVTVLNQTPSAFRQLAAAEQRKTATDAAPGSLRFVIFGGEALEMQSLKPWFERHGDQRPQLVNMYGITETTVHVTYRPLRKDDVNSGSVIGRQIPDLELYILDKAGQPAPIGVPGEIHVGGSGVARGYLNRPELTSEKFIANPFSQDAKGRLYRTGDLARFLPNGDIEYLGRIDDQIKIRGFRIEPGEIESELCRHRSVREAVVVAREENREDKRLIAYLTTRTHQPPVDELRGFLASRLPDYMIPSAFVFLDKFPLTNNGKVDRRALPAPIYDRRNGHKSSLAPRTKVEKTIAGIWRDVLGVKDVGLEDNFFEMGGHSLLLVQVHDRLRTALGRDVPLTKLFQHPTITGLTKYFNEERSQSRGAIDERIQRMTQLQEAAS